MIPHQLCNFKSIQFQSLLCALTRKYLGYLIYDRANRLLNICVSLPNCVFGSKLPDSVIVEKKQAYDKKIVVCIYKVNISHVNEEVQTEKLKVKS